MPSETDRFDHVAGLGARLANLRQPHGPVLGVERDDGTILNVPATATALRLPAPRDMDELLQGGLGAQVGAVLDAAAANPGAAVRVDVAGASFAPLVTRPEKIVCVGFNYRRHAEEVGIAIPSEPPLFAKYANALNRHGGTVTLPTEVDDRFDFETELVIVVGRACRDVPDAEALDHVAGYAIGNDLSARTRQTATTQFGAGKVCDGFAPLGPWLAPRVLVPDPNGLRLRTWMNDDLRQDWTTGDMIFDCRRIVAYCAGLMTLKPGDVIFTGTPQGVIFGEKAPPEQRRWLRAGDRVASSIEGLGELVVTLA